MLKNHFHKLYILFAPLFIFFFNEHNAILANSDGQHYLEIALMQYNVFLSNGVLAGFENLYSYRSEGMRPLLYPVYIAIFMLFTNGDMFLTTSLVMSSIGFFWSLYTYRLILWSGASKYTAAFGSIMIVLWPGFSYYHYNMFSETAHITLLLITIYYILKSNYLSNTSDVIKAGIFGGLMLCVRPELLFIAPIGFIFYGFCYFKKNKNFILELSLILPVFIAFFVSLYASFLVNISPLVGCSSCVSNNYRTDNEDITYLLLLVFFLLAFYMYRFFKNYKLGGLPSTKFPHLTESIEEKKNSNLSTMINIMLLLAFIWYFPFADELLEWFRVGIFNLQDYNNPVAGFEKNWSIIWPQWAALITFLSLIAIATIAFYLFVQKKSISKIFNHHSSQLLIIGFTLTFTYFILLVMENAGITPLRRTAPAVFILVTGIVAFIGILDLKKINILNYSVILFSLIVCFSSITAFSTIYTNTLIDASAYVHKRSGMPWQHTVYGGPPKPSFLLVNEISEAVGRNNIQGSTIEIATFTHWRPDVTHGIYLAIRKLNIRKTYDLGMWISSASRLTVDDLRKNTDTTHLIIDTYPEHSNEYIEEKIGFHFYPGWLALKNIRKGNLQGMVEIDRINANGREYILYEL